MAKGDLGSQNHARRSSACTSCCEDWKGCPDLPVYPVKAACQALGCGHCWVKEKAIVCHRDPKEMRLGGHTLGVTTFTVSCMVEVKWLFGSLKDFPDVPKNCRNHRAGNIPPGLSSPQSHNRPSVHLQRRSH